MSDSKSLFHHHAEISPRPTATEPLPDWCISMNVKINANTQRIFNSLIEPEYRELWLQLPGKDHADRIVASQSKDLFRLDFFQSENLELTILGSYRRCRQRKISFDWWIASSYSVASIVEVRLDGSFQSSVLSLTHRGILGKKEYLWQQEMWKASLAKLQKLFSDDPWSRPARMDG
jgi:hypothetical protein